MALSRKILLIGSGEIAHEYVKALFAFGIRDIHVLSRRVESAAAFCAKWNVSPIEDGAQEHLAQQARSYDGIVIASPIETLLPYLKSLLDLGARRVLVEKPVALRASELDPLLQQYPNAPVMVALNRLFFPSVGALRLVLKDDKPRSAEFSFTEWVHRIPLEKFQPAVLARWGAANCIHVISTVFDLIDDPGAIAAERAGQDELSWHPAGSTFAGSGVTASKVLFSYSSDWGSAGRWSITVRTSKGSYHLEPMEALSFCPKGSVTRETLVPAWGGDIKCGFTEMLSCWLNDETPDSRVSLARLRKHLATVGAILYGEPL
jgi:predicted dehydrogenase